MRFKSLIGPLKGLIKPFNGFIRPNEGIRPSYMIMLM